MDLHGAPSLMARPHRCTPSKHAEVDHDRAWLALPVFNADAVAVALRHLRQQRQGVVVVGETHGLARLQAVERAEDGGVPESFGHAAGVERVDGVG